VQVWKRGGENITGTRLIEQSKKWMKMDRALSPDKELRKDLTNPEFKALTLLVSVLIYSKRCTVDEDVISVKGVISVNYNETVDIPSMLLYMLPLCGFGKVGKSTHSYRLNVCSIRVEISCWID